MRRLLFAALLFLPVVARGAQEIAVNEGNAGNTIIQLQIVASSPQPNGLTGQYRTIDGTATLSDNDYVFAQGDFVIPPGQSQSNIISIQVVGDIKVEADETFAVELFNTPVGSGVDPGPYPIRIRNDDIPVVTVSNPSVTEGNTGTATLAFFVTLSAPAATSVQAAYATSDITATAPSDYLAATGTVTFASGEVTKVVNVTVNGDTAFEANETMRLTVTPTGGAGATGLGTIVNDDAPTFTVSSGRVPEGNAGLTPMTFTVTLPAPAPAAFQLTYATADGTATAGQDYQAVNATLSFTGGETQKTITVNVIGDTSFEPDETFTLNVTGPSGLPITATGTIVNDDAAPIATLRIVSGNGQRGRLGVPLPQPLVVEVLDAAGAPVAGATVSWRVTVGNATLSSQSTLTNAAGRASNTVTLDSVGAVAVEASVGGIRTVVFNLASETLFEERVTGPVAKPIARALDTICARNDNLFAAACRALALLGDGQLTPAIERLAPVQSGAQSKVTGEFVGAVTRGIGSRLAARRNGAERFSIQKLSLSISGQPVAFGSLATAMMQAPASTPEESDYNGWSAFVSGHLGEGERLARAGGEAGFDLKSSGLMAGVDRQFGEAVFGAALHVMKFDADFNAGAGKLDTDGVALSLYGSRGGLFASGAAPGTGSGMRYDGMHLDGSVTFGRSRFDAERDAGTLFGTSRSENDANLFAVTAGTGIDAHSGRTEFDLSLSGTWSRADIDDLSEEGSGPLILFVQGHEIESLLANAGLNVRWTFPTSFGNIIPSLRGDLVHEFQGGARVVTARFLRDQLETGFTVPVDRPDTNFGKVSAGLQAVFPRGLSLFVEVTQDVLRSDLHFRNVQFNVSKSF